MIVSALIVGILLLVGIRIDLGPGTASISEMALAAYTIFVLIARKSITKSITQNEFMFILLTLLFAAGSALLIHGAKERNNYLSDVRNLLLPFVAFMALRRQLTWEAATQNISALCVAGTILSVYAITQALLIPGLPIHQNWAAEEFFNYKKTFVQSTIPYASHIQRFPMALCEQPHDFTGVLVIPCAIAGIYTISTHSPHRRLYGVGFVLMFFCILLGMQRSAALAALAPVILVIFVSRPAIGLLIATVVTTIAFSVAIINTLNWDGGGTITGRFALNNSLIEHIYNNPAALIIGGFKASFIDQNRQLPHAFPLYFALTFGVLFAMFLTLYVVRIVITPIIRARNNLTSPLLAPLLCTASSLLVYGLQTSYFDVAVSSTVFFYALANAIVIEKGEPFDTPASITRLENTK